LSFLSDFADGTESNELEEIIYPHMDFNLHDRWICMPRNENVH